VAGAYRHGRHSTDAALAPSPADAPAPPRRRLVAPAV